MVLYLLTEFPALCVCSAEPNDESGANVDASVSPLN